MLALVNLGFAASGGAGSGISSTVSGVSSFMRGNHVYIVSSSGRVAWVDYLPVRQVTPTTPNLNTFNEAGAVGVYSLSSISGLTAWVDYTPVVEVSDSSNKWRAEADGFIPVVFLE